jgi:putative MFS transporter
VGANALLSIVYHIYRAELYPRQVRARAVGFVYSFSLISTMFTSFMIAFFLKKFGAPGVFWSSRSACSSSLVRSASTGRGP